MDRSMNDGLKFNGLRGVEKRGGVMWNEDVVEGIMNGLTDYTD